MKEREKLEGDLWLIAVGMALGSNPKARKSLMEKLPGPLCKDVRLTDLLQALAEGKGDVEAFRRSFALPKLHACKIQDELIEKLRELVAIRTNRESIDRLAIRPLQLEETIEFLESRLKLIKALQSGQPLNWIIDEDNQDRRARPPDGKAQDDAKGPVEKKANSGKVSPVEGRDAKAPSGSPAGGKDPGSKLAGGTDAGQEPKQEKKGGDDRPTSPPEARPGQHRQGDSGPPL